MSANVGKEFEARLKSDWEKSLPTAWIYRLKDITMGYKNVANISDFIAYKYPILYVIEAKSTDKNTFPIAFRQYEALKELELKAIPGIAVGVIIWFKGHDKVLWVPISTFMQLEAEGKKSFNIKEKESYLNYEIEGEKLRTFMRLNFESFTRWADEYYRLTD